MAPASDADLIPLIRKLESIAQLADAERQAILSLPANIRAVDARQDIVSEKDRPSHCCLVLSGWVCRYKLLDQGKRQILSYHVPGDLPDLQSLHLAVMDHSLATVTASRLAFIPHENMRDAILRFPNLGAALWRDTLIDSAIFREWMTGIGRRSAQARIAHQLCEMYMKLEAVGLAQQHRCELPITQSDIADGLGLTNVHVNRSLKVLRSRGLLTLRGRELVIHDWSGLTQAAEFDPTYLHLEPRAA
ncbi:MULTISPECIES: Crp/Fnr family transcriptional regulator [Methylobacterium]|uniref:Crp/Fnr family transcriptional regulator n=1 Tax=Methylobacterium TaxID=407 RepID=UPI001A9D966E|nr:MULTISPECIES: Crp/Fnr family transcriptional regulator [Methylobacterium]MDR7036670.1 CRP-like cAMP-binding protein [Methylobacterium sp. BE186]